MNFRNLFVNPVMFVLIGGYISLLAHNQTEGSNQATQASAITAKEEVFKTALLNAIKSNDLSVLNS